MDVCVSHTSSSPDEIWEAWKQLFVQYRQMVDWHFLMEICSAGEYWTDTDITDTVSNLPE